jgi:hypothetical protein
MGGKFRVEQHPAKDVLVIADRVGVFGEYYAQVFIKGRLSFSTRRFGGTAARQRAIDLCLKWLKRKAR